MKRFFLKFLLFVVPVALFFLAMNSLYERTNYWKSKDYANKYTDAPYDIELGCFGSSIPCYALKFDVVPEIKAWNFANVKETYVWSYRVLKNYIKHFKEGSVILVEIPFFGVHSRVRSFRERYYRILPKDDMDEWSLSEWLAYKEFPILTSGRFKTVIFRDIPKEEMSSFFDRDSYMSDEELLNFATKTYDAFFISPKDGYEKNFEEVSAIIDLCYKNKTVPVIVAYPLVDLLTKFYDDEEFFFESYYGFVKDLQEKYPGLVFLDYSHDIDLTTRHDYYKDAVHMNKAGAEAFTLKLVGDLRARGLVK